jgi:DNA-binding CsgD family transcriptional regulator
MPRSSGERSLCSCGSASDHLTVREIEILRLVAAGMTNILIARTLRISIRTVDQHLVNMMHRTRSMNRGELIARAFVAGILQPDAWPPQWSGICCPAIS